MQRFLKLFGSWIQFFYLCFDRVVINGYGSLLTRENSVIYFFQEVCEILTPLRDDLQKLRVHGLIERVPKSYIYRTTTAGQKQIILLLQIQKRVYGPLAHSALVRRPDPLQMPNLISAYAFFQTNLRKKVPKRCAPGTIEMETKNIIELKCFGSA